MSKFSRIRRSFSEKRLASEIPVTGLRMDYFRERELTSDWTSSHLPLWEKLLADKVDVAASVLEVGSFEGRSALFFLQFLPKSKLTCVDTFGGNVEHNTPGDERLSDMMKVEARFDANMRPFGDRVEKRKGPSIVILTELRAHQRSFDVVYIDGDHHAASAFTDARLGWELLANDGIMILDDYLWEPHFPLVDRPEAGIKAFLQEIVGEFELLHDGYQVIIRKLASAAALARSCTVTSTSDPLASGVIGSPLVSFVVINWNYGRYVGATIDSIRNQDYPHFECIVIDNGSTDDSAEIIARHTKGDPRFRVETMARNHGQLGAALWVLDKIKGSFVTFVDADDVLVQNYASMHLQVHLALPTSVAFTSANVIEMDASGRALTSSHAHFRPNMEEAVRGLRDEGIALRLPSVSSSQYSLLTANTASIPSWVAGWLWAPGTANMFRVSLLRLVRFNDGSKPLLQPADGYFNKICHALAGSALIDVPLSGYRLHSSNDFATGESIRVLRGGTRQVVRKSHDFSYEIIDYLLAESDRFGWLLNTNFWPFLNQITSESWVPDRSYFSNPKAVEIFIRHAPKLVSNFGAALFSREIVARFSGTQARSILRAGFGGQLSWQHHRKVISNGFRLWLQPKKRRNGARV
ncbi:glycosyltransferase [Mesorhizobium loti]|uniref:glycosyltransferase n=1 Tax=Rhizobium loti TaxID=381 RepID=UPI001427CF68|nr:glycosyltransferase [Mesorhizobium loti]